MPSGPCAEPVSAADPVLVDGGDGGESGRGWCSEIDCMTVMSTKASSSRQRSHQIKEKGQQQEKAARYINCLQSGDVCLTFA